uniref:Uncharacterized protein n=1 Tax=Arundo donax TaxID=35708 RepID=A0A0A8ZGV6_ARUDO
MFNKKQTWSIDKLITDSKIIFLDNNWHD